MRAAIYARFSTDKQSETSVHDQIRAAQAYAEARGWVVVSTHADEELSGSVPVALRPGGKALMADLMAKRFDILILEGLDRLSREISESESVVKRLEHRKVRIVGICDGYDSNATGRKVVRIARGMVNELYLDDVRDKTHRGLKANLARGMSAGGLTYGYTTEQTPIGRRTVIHPEQANHVRWIFQQLLDGRSPRWIVADLNARGVTSARGGTWAVSAIVGNTTKGLGLMNNRLYIGQVVWNRSQWLKDPETGRRRQVHRPENEWIVRNDESLRIIDQPTWDALQSMNRGGPGRGIKRGKGQAPKSLFGGLLTCGTCGGPVIAVNKLRYGCGVHKDRGPSVCPNSRTVVRDVLDKRLLSVVRDELSSPWALQMLVKEVRTLVATHNKGAATTGASHRRRIDQLDAQIQRLIEAITTIGISPSLSAALRKAEAEREQLAAELPRTRELKAELVITDVEARYKRMLMRLQDILNDEDRDSTRRMLADMIGPVVLENEKDGTVAVLCEPAERLMVSAVGESLGLVAGARNFNQRRIRIG